MQFHTGIGTIKPPPLTPLLLGRGLGPGPPAGGVGPGAGLRLGRHGFVGAELERASVVGL